MDGINKTKKRIKMYKTCSTKQKTSALICMILIIILISVICNSLNFGTKSEKKFKCKLPSDHIIHHVIDNRTKYRTEMGRLVYLNEKDCNLIYGCTAVPTSKITFDTAAHCFDIDPRKKIKLIGMDKYDKIGNIIRIPIHDFTFVQHKDFNFEKRINDYARIILINLKYSDEIRPYSAHEPNVIKTWINQEIGNLETRTEKVNLLSLSECKRKFPVSEPIWQALDQSEKGEAEHMICVEHKDVNIEQGNSGTALITTQGSFYALSTLSCSPPDNSNYPSIFTIRPESDYWTEF